MVYLPHSRTLHYFAADGGPGGVAVAKGEVVVLDIQRHTTEPLMLVFRVQSARRSAGKNVAGAQASKPRDLLARAPNEAEQARWLGDRAQRL